MRACKYIILLIHISEDTAYKSWESWSDCNATSCGYGKRTRKRECKLVPKYPPEGVLICKSPSQDYQYISCYNDSCPRKFWGCLFRYEATIRQNG